MLTEFASRHSPDLDKRELKALEHLYALASREVERHFSLDEDARRRLANIVVFTYRSASRDPAASDDCSERQLVDDCLQRFLPLHRAVSNVLRRRRL